MKIKLEIELSEKLYEQVCKAAKSQNTTPEKFVVKAARSMAGRSREMSDSEVTESLNKFFAKYPELAPMEAQQYWQN